MKSKTTVLQLLRAVAILSAILCAAAAARAEVIEQILFKVNGEIFTKTDLETRQIAKLRELQGQKPDLKNADNEELQKTLNEITPEILVDVVDEMLVVQRGKELGYSLSDQQFQSVLEDIRKQNKLESEEQFQAALKQEGVTLAELRKNMERSMIFQRVQQNEVVNKIAMTDDEARAYYDSHLAEFTKPASATLREILISAPAADPRGINVAADEAVKARAEAIRARAAGGENFEKLAGDVSDSASRASGGLIGPINLDDLSADLRKLIDSMKVGDVSQPLRTTRGYQILKLEALTPKETTSFDAARTQISDHVLDEKRGREFMKYIEKLRGEAIIEWKNESIKKAYDDGVKHQADIAAATPPSR
jgi:peptidyl-prolyl cis-trans isomerase SurA